MTKAKLRTKYKNLREKLTPDQLEEMSVMVANKVLELDIWDLNYYHIFLPIQEKNEVNTEYIMNILAGKDKHIVLPKSDINTSSLEHILLTDNTKLKKNEYGIPEPVAGIEIPVKNIDVVFIPLLAFDLQGNRVGYGKGFYDRFLLSCNDETVKIGLSFFEAEKKIEGINKFDASMDMCVTPDKIYEFSEI